MNSFRYLIILVLFLNCSHRRLEVLARVPQAPPYTDVRYVKISFRIEGNFMFIEISNTDKPDTERALFLRILPIRNFKMYLKPIANLFSKTTRRMMYNLISISRFKMMCLFRRSLTKQNRFSTNSKQHLKYSFLLALSFGTSKPENLDILFPLEI